MDFHNAMDFYDSMGFQDGLVLEVQSADQRCSKYSSLHSSIPLSSMRPVLLVTSTSRPGRHLISALLASPDCPTIRVIARSNANIQETFPLPLRSAPHSIVVADQFHGQDFESAFRGVSVVFHNGPSVSVQEEAMSFAVIDAAKEAGVKHFVLCSVFHPMRTKLQTHKAKLAIEEYLVESRLNYTILQPTHYMQNVPLEHALKTRKIPTAYASSVVHGFVDLYDLAAVARKVILAPSRHNFARYELIGQNMSYDDIARTVSRVCHLDVHCDVMPTKDFIAGMKASGEIKNEHAEDAVERLMLYYGRWGLTGNPNILRWVLEREPTTWESYIRREVRNM